MVNDGKAFLIPWYLLKPVAIKLKERYEGTIKTSLRDFDECPKFASCESQKLDKLLSSLLQIHKKSEKMIIISRLRCLSTVNFEFCWTVSTEKLIY